MCRTSTYRILLYSNTIILLSQIYSSKKVFQSSSKYKSYPKISGGSFRENETKVCLGAMETFLRGVFRLKILLDLPLNFPNFNEKWWGNPFSFQIFFTDIRRRRLFRTSISLKNVRCLEDQEKKTSDVQNWCSE